METNKITTQITRLSLSRRVTVLVLFLSILAIGLIATSRLPVEMYPKGQEGHSMEIRTGWSSGVAQESMEKLGLPMEKTFTNLHKYGNTAGASVPIAMREAMDEGLIGPGSLVVTAAFGGGLAWGANVIQF